MDKKERKKSNMTEDTKTSPEIMKDDANQLYKQKQYDRVCVVIRPYLKKKNSNRSSTGRGVIHPSDSNRFERFFASGDFVFESCCLLSQDK